MTHKNYARVVTGALVLILTACASGPSSGAVEKAFTAWTLENGSNDTVVSNFKLGTCTQKSDGPGYACSLQAHIVGVGGRVNQDVQGVYVIDKIGSDWKVVGMSQ